MSAQAWFIKYDNFLFLAYVFLPVLLCVCVTWKLRMFSCGTLCSCYETSWIRANWNTSHYFTFDPKRWNCWSLTKQPELQSLQRMQISNELIPSNDFLSFSHLFPHPKVKDTLAIKMSTFTFLKASRPLDGIGFINSEHWDNWDFCSICKCIYCLKWGCTVQLWSHLLPANLNASIGCSILEIVGEKKENHFRILEVKRIKTPKQVCFTCVYFLLFFDILTIGIYFILRTCCTHFE